MAIPIFTYSHNEQSLTQVGIMIHKLQACMWAYTGIPRAREKHGQTVLLLHIKIDMSSDKIFALLGCCTP